MPVPPSDPSDLTAEREPSLSHLLPLSFSPSIISQTCFNRRSFRRSMRDALRSSASLVLFLYFLFLYFPPSRSISISIIDDPRGAAFANLRDVGADFCSLGARCRESILSRMVLSAFVRTSVLYYVSPHCTERKEQMCGRFRGCMRRMRSAM